MNKDPFKEYIKQTESNKRDKGYAWLKNGVYETTEYLELFLRNLLLDEKNELHNRSMHISGMFEEVGVESSKANIENVEANIEKQKADIERVLAYRHMFAS